MTSAVTPFGTKEARQRLKNDAFVKRFQEERWREFRERYPFGTEPHGKAQNKFLCRVCGRRIRLTGRGTFWKHPKRFHQMTARELDGLAWRRKHSRNRTVPCPGSGTKPHDHLPTGWRLRGTE